MLTELLDRYRDAVMGSHTDHTFCSKRPCQYERRELAARAKLEAYVAELSVERDELQGIFDANWKADMRAVARWRAVDPEARELIHPDRADLVVWLLEQHGELEDSLGVTLSEVMKERQKVAELEARLSCNCGHSRSAHSGHCTPVGSPESTHCSACFCKAYTTTEERSPIHLTDKAADIHDNANIHSSCEERIRELEARLAVLQPCSHKWSGASPDTRIQECQYCGAKKKGCVIWQP